MFPLSIIFLLTVFVNAKQITNTQICFILLQIYYFRLLVRSFVRFSAKKKYLERDHVKLESPFSVRIWKVRKDNLVLGIFQDDSQTFKRVEY
jgi:hypothetical protein